MSPFLLGVLIVTAVLTAAALIRVVIGPTVFDRLVAVALLSVNAVVLLVLLGFVFERGDLFLDIALVFAMLSFLLPVVLGRYFEERQDGASSDGLPADGSAPKPRGIVPQGLYAARGRRYGQGGTRTDDPEGRSARDTPDTRDDRSDGA
jgi:multicomponent Na+:H+ antiporter subunit F